MVGTVGTVFDPGDRDMGNDEKGPHDPRIDCKVSAEILPVEFSDKIIMAPVLDGVHDEYTQVELADTNVVQYWDDSGPRDIWMLVNSDQTRVLRLVIEPVSKDAAHHIRRDYDKVSDVETDWPKFDEWAKRDVRLNDDLAASMKQTVQGIVDRIEDARSEHEYRTQFLYALLRLPDQFVCVNGRVEPLVDHMWSYANELKPADMALLKRVWRRLPLKYQSLRKPLPIRADLTEGERCPSCGSPKRERPSYKKRTKLRKALAQFHKEYPQDVFNDWVKTRLRSRPGDFTYTRVLYADYVAWVQKGGIIVRERSVMRDTMLSRDIWGRLMGEQFERVKRNGRMGYRPVALKGTRRRT